MTTPILDRVLQDLTHRYGDRRPAIQDLLLGAPFIVTRLTNGSIGSSLNFAVQNEDRFFDPAAARIAALSLVSHDPLLLNFARSSDTTNAGIATAVATALSQPLLRAPPLGELVVEPVSCWQDHLAIQSRGTDRVCQIGLGGSLDAFARPGVVAEIVVCDLMFTDPQELTRARELLQHRGLDLTNVRFQSSALYSPAMETADVVCITGSTLCNATIDALLRSIRKARVVALQGPSCSIYAPVLFNAGVTVIYAPLKREQEWALAMLADPLLNDFVDGDYLAIYGRGAGLSDAL